MTDAKSDRRRERRRRKLDTKTDGGQMGGNEFQKTLENSEFPIKTHVTHSSGKLTRRDTYTVLHSKSDFDVGNMDEEDIEDFQPKSEGSSANLTYSLNKASPSSDHCTYNIDKPPDLEIRPVPAPRKRKPSEKLSSDTDRDVTEIDLDDLRLKSPDSSSKPSLASLNTEAGLSSDSIAPVPKPRKRIQNQENPPETKEENNEKTEEKPKEQDKTSGDESERQETNELPLVTDVQEQAKTDETGQKSKKQTRLIGDLLDRKKKKTTFSSLIKLEKKKMPRISSILKDLKEDESKDKQEVDEDKPDFQIDSPRYKESAQNGQIYVQGKNGFHAMNREEVLKSGSDRLEAEGNGGLMEDSNVKTAIVFQKFWSRSMKYFHGVLAGIGFSHAAAITAIMLHYNYDPESFISVYSCLSLKVHYVFYTLIALCIVSSFDRVDIGHMNKHHWDNALKSPSTWAILILYLISFALTFANQKSEARFDAFPTGNQTEIWEGQTQGEIQVGLLQWYHSVWARDALVLFAWLLVSLSKFEDFLHSHINNMAKYANVKDEKGHRHKIEYGQ